ncbi:uncharacterized protein DUF4304 [Arthrobacter sp. SLBN-122]|nr:uncharacterized protein DUF4304 [Arthrobacter sp. SLBN-122]
MSRNVIQTTFDGLMESAGFSKTSGSWYRITDDVITVVELQKSQYGLQYYVNIALWLRPLGETRTRRSRCATSGPASHSLLEAKRTSSQLCWILTSRCLKINGPRISRLSSLSTWGQCWRR